MTVHRGHGQRLAPHDLQVHENFTRAFPRAKQLVALEIHQTHVLRFHEALADKCGRAKCDILANANGNVAAIPIREGALPQAPSDVADL